MKFENKTLMVMKHFSTINPSLLINRGETQLATLSETKSVYAAATIRQVFDHEIGIFDLHRFFGVYNLFKEPEATVTNKVIELSDGTKTLSYTLADPAHIKAPPVGKTPKLPSEDVRVNVTRDALIDVLKAAGSLGMPEIAFVSKDGQIGLETSNGRNPTSDIFRIGLGPIEAKSFKITFKVENIKVIPADYSVTLSYGKRSFWDGVVFEDTDIRYMIAGEDSSRV